MAATIWLLPHLWFVFLIFIWSLFASYRVLCIELCNFKSSALIISLDFYLMMSCLPLSVTVVWKLLNLKDIFCTARKGGRTGFLRRKEEERSSTLSRSATSSKGFLRRKEERTSSLSTSATSSRQEWAEKRKSRQLDSQGRVRKSVKPRSFERIQNRSRAYDEEESAGKLFTYSNAEISLMQGL